MHGGRRVVLVSSGAIACGQHVLGVSERPRLVPALQAASAVGQGRLFAHYERLFGDHELTAAQVLLTSDDFARRTSYVNARNTLRRLLGWGVVPVVNENDTTATDEIRFGDNDVLAAQVAIMLRAATARAAHRPGRPLHQRPAARPEARLVTRVEHPRELVALDVGERLAAGRRRHARQGGRRASWPRAADVRTVIANGSRPGVLARRRRRRARRDVGRAAADPACRPSSSGSATPNRCVVRLRSTLGRCAPWRRAAAACCPSASRPCTAAFVAGDAVAIVDADGVEVARGLATMSARDLRRVRGLRSDEVRALNPQLEDEVVHRDCLVLVGEEAE